MEPNPKVEPTTSVSTTSVHRATCATEDEDFLIYWSGLDRIRLNYRPCVTKYMQLATRLGVRIQLHPNICFYLNALFGNGKLCQVWPKA